MRLLVFILLVVAVAFLVAFTFAAPAPQIGFDTGARGTGPSNPASGNIAFGSPAAAQIG
ncbi:hypothetical protein AAVH_17146 [Aphelenchoides avenae]|nr:hypothetical protein AAVH_17146 [Aphelenchus avenae]